MLDSFLRISICMLLNYIPFDYMLCSTLNHLGIGVITPLDLDYMLVNCMPCFTLTYRVTLSDCFSENQHLPHKYGIRLLTELERCSDGLKTQCRKT